MITQLRNNFKDCLAWKNEGIPLSTTSNECCKLYDAAITQYVGWYDDPNFGGLEKTLEAITAADPNFVLGKALNIGLELMGTGNTIRLNSSFSNELDDLMNLMESQEKHLTYREKLHVEAIRLFAKGYMSKATDKWENILLDYPLDMLAIKMAHDSYFYLGKQFEMRDSIARVLPYWNERVPLHSYLFGMYSFGLVETNFYDKAELNAKKGLDLNCNDAWATHALAHVYETGGRQDEGITFLSKTVQDWQPCEMLSCHNFWHWAVYHVEKGEHEAALDLFDYQIAKSMKSSQGALLDIVDASSILFRLEMEGIEVGKERWTDVYSLCVPHLDDHILLFNDAHLLMSYLGCHNKETTTKFMKSVRDYAVTNDNDTSELMKSFGIKLLDGMIAFHEKNYDEAFELLNSIKYSIFKAGGSDAQRDVFNQLLVHSAINASDKYKTAAKALLQERKAMKENSPLTDRLTAKWLSKHQDQ